MEQYIKKSDIVAEIERRISQLESKYKELSNVEIWITAKEIKHKINGLKEALSIVNTSEAKEVDLEKEAENFVKTEEFVKNESSVLAIAKHFFELGLRSTITEDDCKIIWNIGDSIPYMSEDDFFKELLKRYREYKRK